MLFLECARPVYHNADYAELRVFFNCFVWMFSFSKVSLHMQYCFLDLLLLILKHHRILTYLPVKLAKSCNLFSPDCLNGCHCITAHRQLTFYCFPILALSLYTFKNFLCFFALDMLIQPLASVSINHYCDDHYLHWQGLNNI